MQNIIKISLMLMMILVPVYFAQIYIAHRPVPPPKKVDQSPPPKPEVLSASSKSIPTLKEIGYTVPVTFNKDVVFKGNILINGKLYDPENLDTDVQSVSFSSGKGIALVGDSAQSINNTGVLSLQGQTGDLSLTAGSGISLSGLSVSNSDPGSGQSIFKNIDITGVGTIAAGNNNDTFSMNGGDGISLSLDQVAKRITVSQNIATDLTMYGLVYAKSDSSLATLDGGTSGFLLESQGGALPVWVDPATFRTNDLPFSGITSGVSTAVLTIGTGSVLSAQGTGIIDATELLGNTWSSPGAIGQTTPSSAAFTTFMAGGPVTFSALGKGIAHVSPAGMVSSSAVDLGSSDVTGTLPALNNYLPFSGGTMTGNLNSLSIIPTVDNASNLGSSSYYYNTVYARNFVSPAGNLTNFWQLNNGALSPANLTNDLLLGGTSTSSAKFGFLNVAGGTPTASISGNITLNSAGIIQTTNKQTLTLGGNTTGDIQFKPASSSSSLYLASNGNVGIGTASPGAALDVNGSTNLEGDVTLSTQKRIFIGTSGAYIGNYDLGFPGRIQINGGAQSLELINLSELYFTGSSIPNLQLWSTGDRTMSIVNGGGGKGNFSVQNNIMTGGTLGVNTSSALGVLDVRGIGTNILSGTIPIASLSGKTSFAGLVIDNSGSGDLFTASTSGSTKFVIDNKGNTKIFGGSLCVKANNNLPCGAGTPGNIYATSSTIGSADVAENYVSSQTLEPGDLVMMANDGNDMAVVESNSSYQQQLIGVISTSPGVTLNSDAVIDSSHKFIYPVALNGRVPVKVSTENGTINVGDYLTSSSVTGVAMKATEGGIVIGKALESYGESGIGKIMTYINVGYNNPSQNPSSNILTNLPGNQLLSENNATISGTLSVAGKSLLNDLSVTGTVHAGLLNINGLDTSDSTSSATINTLSGPLKMQSLALNGVDFENGKIVIDPGGNLTVKETVTAKKYAVDTSDVKSSSFGEAALPAGENNIIVQTSAVTDNSGVFVTAENELSSPLFIEEKKSGISFTVGISTPQPQAVKFNWWIVN